MMWVSAAAALTQGMHSERCSRAVELLACAARRRQGEAARGGCSGMPCHRQGGAANPGKLAPSVGQGSRLQEPPERCETCACAWAGIPLLSCLQGAPAAAAQPKGSSAHGWCSALHPAPALLPTTPAVLRPRSTCRARAAGISEVLPGTGGPSGCGHAGVSAGRGAGVGPCAAHLCDIRVRAGERCGGVSRGAAWAQQGAAWGVWAWSCGLGSCGQVWGALVSHGESGGACWVL